MLKTPLLLAEKFANCSPISTVFFASIGSISHYYYLAQNDVEISIDKSTQYCKGFT